MPTEVAPDPLAPPTERLAAPPVLFSPSDFAAAAGAYTDFRRSPTGDVDAWVEAFADDPGPADLFRALHHKSPAAALQMAAAAARLPEAGDEFVGFRLLRELGRGAFGRVFLAEQRELADRQVALKVSLDAAGRGRGPGPAPAHQHRPGLLGPPVRACTRPCACRTSAPRPWPTPCRRVPRTTTLPESGKGLVTLLQSSAATGRPPAPGRRAASRRPQFADPVIGHDRRPPAQLESRARPARRADATSMPSCGSGRGWPTGWPTPTSAASCTAT